MSDFAAARLKMIESQIQTEGVTDHAVLGAMGAVPRERFVPAKQRALAYIDEDILLRPAAADRPARYLMEPAPLARLIEAAEIRPTDRVMVVGCGSGYSAAVLGRLAASVVGLESDASLAAEASAALSEIGAANASVITGPLEQGFRNSAPYDVILVEGSVEAVPDELLAQIAEGGRLMAVVGHGRSASAKVYTRTDGEVAGRTVFNADVRPLPGFSRPKSFVF
jgi:protein-L-isoaspartate(D-aspartate) O-methyltransferase